MARLYDPLSLRDAGDVLSRYGATYVVSGTEEREAHGGGHAALFAALPELLQPAFRAGDVTLYRVLAGGRYQREQFLLDSLPAKRPPPDPNN